MIVPPLGIIACIEKSMKEEMYKVEHLNAQLQKQLGPHMVCSLFSFVSLRAGVFEIFLKQRMG